VSSSSQTEPATMLYSPSFH